MKIVVIVLALAIVLALIFARKSRGPKLALNSKYHAGQSWTFHTPADQPNAKLTILLVEAHPQLGTIVHIALSGLSLPNGASSIQHMPFAEAAIDKSVIDVTEENVQVPAFQEGYDQWHQALERGKAGIFSVSVTEGFEVVRQTIEKHSK